MLVNRRKFKKYTK